MLKVVELHHINDGAPAQWQGYDSDEKPVYVRYRDGYLSVCVGQRGDSIFSAVYGSEVFGRQVGDAHSDMIDFAELKAITAGVVEWPDENV
jgi:hypothetical protein